jgi:hypothetical protein
VQERKTPLSEETKSTGGSRKEDVPSEDSKTTGNEKGGRIAGDPTRNNEVTAPHGH